MVCRATVKVLVTAGMVFGSSVALVSYPGGVEAAYEDALDLPELQARMEEDEAARKDIDQKAAVMAERIQLKDALIRDLIAGRTTLAEVTHRFYELNVAYPACMNVIRSRYPNTPDDERMALNVIEFVQLQDMPPEQANFVAARLGDEFRQMFGHRSQPAH